MSSPAAVLFGPNAPSRETALRAALIAAAAAAAAALVSRRRHQSTAQQQSEGTIDSAEVASDCHATDLAPHFAQMPSGTARVGVNKEFLRQLRAVLRICIPSATSKEVLLLALHTSFLLLRTYISVLVAKIDGRIVRDLVAANGREFLKGLGYWFAIALPATYTNSMIRYLQSKLGMAFRSRLMNHIHELYLDDKLGYYKLLTLDNNIEAPDQFIVSDVARFCDVVASVYSNVGKPVIDIIIFNYQLSKYIGWTGMTGLFVNYMVTARLLRAVTPAFGRMAAQEAKLEGEFRTAHTRLTLNAEEICFYNGEDREKTLLNDAYMRLVKHVNSIYRTRVGYNMFEDFLIKYVWSAVGLGVCAVPVFLPEYSGSKSRSAAVTGSPTTTGSSHAPSSSPSASLSMPSVSSLTEEHLNGSSNLPEAMVVDPTPRAARSHTQSFITNKRLLLSLADAGGRIMFSLKEISELAGFTSRVYSLLSVLHAVHGGHYPAAEAAAAAARAQGAAEPTKYSLAAIHGSTKVGGDSLVLNNIDVVVPNAAGGAGQPLATGLSVTLRQGDHLLIQGGNGAGKTSVARIVRGLWPVFEGTIERPHAQDLFFIPQRPYLVLGTLRDQVIYPDSAKDMARKGKTDTDLLGILELVHLAYLPGREGGWDTVKEWKDVCSGGEKQRLNMARLFYHCPKFAFLDECTSAVSNDVEALLYQTAKDMGITITTVSHRPALSKYHRAILRFKDDGSYEVTQTGTAAEVMSLEREIQSLEERISAMPKHKTRLEEVNIELGLAQ
ncbi:ABC transporter transmembrane region 2-domain-containing protein [Blastocladiella britannica]|nr:ABC transporter transmembrane region 2-domain-containing protein [Blastocladiella britannica]